MPSRSKTEHFTHIYVVLFFSAESHFVYKTFTRMQEAKFSMKHLKSGIMTDGSSSLNHKHGNRFKIHNFISLMWCIDGIWQMLTLNLT